MIPAQLSDTRIQLARDIYEWCRSQVSLWQQVPWLALQADGRSGWSDDYSRAYRWGLWTLPIIQASYHCAFVNCDNGELIARPEVLNALSEATVLQLPLASIDAEAVLEQLHVAAKRPYLYFPAEQEQTEQRRASEATRFGLAADRPYRRLRPIVVSEEYG